jgi:hypothetical protein
LKEDEEALSGEECSWSAQIVLLSASPLLATDTGRLGGGRLLEWVLLLPAVLRMRRSVSELDATTDSEEEEQGKLMLLDTSRCGEAAAVVVVVVAVAVAVAGVAAVAVG